MNLEQGVKAFVKDSQEGVNDIHREVFFQLSRDVIMATPVGDPDKWRITEAQRAAIKASGYKGGRLRGNWYAGVNKRPKLVTKQIDPGGQRTVERMQRKAMTTKNSRS